MPDNIRNDHCQSPIRQRDVIEVVATDLLRGLIKVVKDVALDVGEVDGKKAL